MISLLPHIGFDHSPISLSVVPIEPKRNFPFWFEKMWTSHPDLVEKVKSWWAIDVEGLAMFRVTRKLSNVKRKIKVWNKIDFGHIFKEKEDLSVKLSSVQEPIQQEGYNESNRESELAILTEMHDIISKKDKFWRQRSRINWLKDGDQNTKFFHLTTLKHRANNKIYGIKKGQDLLTKENDILAKVVSFFSSLLSWDTLLSKVD